MNTSKRIGQTALVVSGGLLLAVGLVCGLIYVALPLFYRAADLIQTHLLPASCAGLALLGGALLAYQGIRGLLDRPSRLFRPPRPGWLIALFLLALLAGEGILLLGRRSPQIAAYLFPPWHFMAALIPSWAVLAFVARQIPAREGSPNSWRMMIVQSAYGAMMVPLLAFALEASIVGLASILLFLGLSSIPGGVERLREIVSLLQSPSLPQDPQQIGALILWPPIAALIGLGLVVVAPLVEELLKPLGVALAARPGVQRSDAFLWGVAAGAGFAAAESLFNGPLLLDAWGAGMLARGGATLVHTLASGWIGLGWYAAIVEGRWLRLLRNIAGGFALHALWNGLIVTLGLLALASTTQLPVLEGSLLAGLMGLFLGGSLLVYSVILAVTLLRLSRRLGGESIVGELAPP
ncbi:MAG: PrsW family intramembrane metalloprotease [Chloroflexi bacterium]|nr:PrsW family intramembrane metalloprotease [Chloroflexota bacterium]